MDRRTVFLGKFRFNVDSRMSRFAMALVMVFALTLLTTHAIEAQTFSVLHNFSGEGDGANPYAGLTVTSSGVLYGTATYGGTYNNYGTVFKLSQVSSSWVFSPLFEFAGNIDGANPEGGVVIGPNGALYGTAEVRGAANDGTVFELRPPATFCGSILCYWNEFVLYTFAGAPADGAGPQVENLVFDQAGNIYGTTEEGGTYGDGTVFELTPSGQGYMESILHNFGSGSDGLYPYSGVVLDTAGNVYGTTYAGGTGAAGTVYQLVPSNGGWVENVLVNFGGTNGDGPFSNLIIDASGNLYGTTYGGGQNGGGVVFKLAPSEGGFAYSVLYTFSEYCDSWGGVAIDTAGDFFGVCSFGGAHDDGWIFELTNCSQGCTLVDLHDFSGSDGANPYGSPTLDAHGNLYGTTVYGGTNDGGVVWEIAGVGAQH
ncbi:MAG: choice-of-anchor tandem repeat GloVer-containing protein [Candidatus Korobacteraceae bacterium]|jgi:uncharacterized repeat protein (TIGR03803 family)